VSLNSRWRVGGAGGEAGQHEEDKGGGRVMALLLDGSHNNVMPSVRGMTGGENSTGGP
jgi:hypothetical protein